MKRTFSLILAALLLSTTLASCGGENGPETTPPDTTPAETASTETASPETKSTETASPETEEAEPTPASPLNITENGVAKAHIVLQGGATADEQTAANELALHIKLVSNAEVPIIIGDEALVSGAEVTVADSVMEDSIPIIVATPATLPELETLFPDDLAWLRTTKDEEGKTYGPDGFAIRQLDGKIYIFGATAEGTLNGAYDFIEDNLGVIWVNSSASGTVFDEMPTITVSKNSYREKSPFTMRYGFGTALLDQRNKHDTEARPVGNCHNVKWLLTTSPTYDPNMMEYWETDVNGNPMKSEKSEIDSGQINYWSELTANTIADSVIAKLAEYGENYPKYYTASMEDWGFRTGVFPDQTLPFEYAPGQFVEPEHDRYLSTVYFTFINRIARRVAEKYPDVTINTLAYDWAIEPPLCELEDNIMIWFCPITENYTQKSFDEALEEANTSSDPSLAALEAKAYDDWNKEHPDTPALLFDYYFCHYVGGWYERPLWYRMQNDFQYYAETGCLGTYSCASYYDTSNSYYSWQKGYGGGKQVGLDAGYKQIFTYAEAHAMNILSEWIFYKITWNPYEDVDALIDYFCDKVYRDASDEMQEYYALLLESWYVGAELIAEDFNAHIHVANEAGYYYYYFLDIDTPDGVYVHDALAEAITKAYEAADDRTKEFIRRPYECFTGGWDRFIE